MAKSSEGAILVQVTVLMPLRNVLQQLAPFFTELVCIRQNKSQGTLDQEFAAQVGVIF